MAHRAWRTLCVLAVIVSATLAQDSCYQEDPGDMITTVQEEYGCAIFECYNQTINQTAYDGYSFTGWILPDLRVVNSSYDDGRISVIYDPDPVSFTIRIRNVSRDDLGLYHCMLTYDPTGAYYLIRFGLNSKGPFFITGWEEYKMNTIVGCSAFGGFLVLTGLIYLFWNIRYVSSEDDDDDEDEKSLEKYHPSTVSAGVPYNNSVPGYVPAIENTKPTANGNWSFGTDSPGDVRKRAALAQASSQPAGAQGYQNKAFDGTEPKQRLDEQAVDSFFIETVKDENQAHSNLKHGGDAIITTEL